MPYSGLYARPAAGYFGGGNAASRRTRLDAEEEERRRRAALDASRTQDQGTLSRLFTGAAIGAGVEPANVARTTGRPAVDADLGPAEEAAGLAAAASIQRTAAALADQDMAAIEAEDARKRRELANVRHNLPPEPSPFASKTIAYSPVFGTPLRPIQPESVAGGAMPSPAQGGRLAGERVRGETPTGLASPLLGFGLRRQPVGSGQRVDMGGEGNVIQPRVTETVSPERQTEIGARAQKFGNRANEDTARANEYDRMADDAERRGDAAAADRFRARGTEFRESADRNEAEAQRVRQEALPAPAGTARIRRLMEEQGIGEDEARRRVQYGDIGPGSVLRRLEAAQPGAAARLKSALMATRAAGEAAAAEGRRATAEAKGAEALAGRTGEAAGAEVRRTQGAASESEAAAGESRARARMTNILSDIAEKLPEDKRGQLLGIQDRPVAEQMAVLGEMAAQETDPAQKKVLQDAALHVAGLAREESPGRLESLLRLGSGLFRIPVGGAWRIISGDPTMAREGAREAIEGAKGLWAGSQSRVVPVAGKPSLTGGGAEGGGGLDVVAAMPLSRLEARARNTPADSPWNREIDRRRHQVAALDDKTLAAAIEDARRKRLPLSPLFVEEARKRERAQTAGKR